MGLRCRVLVGVVMGFVAVGVAWAQPAAPREIQTGTKMSDLCYVAVSEVTVKAADAAKTENLISQAMQELGTMATDAGFSPVGTLHVAVVGPLPPPPPGDITLQVRLPILEQPTEEDLKPGGPLTIVKLEATKVAYTYHRGPISDAETSFMRLFQWAAGQQLETTGAPSLIVYQYNPDPMRQVVELQVPVK